jgi:CheY-like chemotaxis protein
LFVDDEPRVLDGIRRQLRNRFQVTTADDPEKGLSTLESEGPFAVVVSDMRMPRMNGAQFLARVREQSPDTIRMILSGQSDLDAAIDAVNNGSIFRFLTKPVSPESLAQTLQTGLDQFRLVAGEKDLLDRTLGGAIQVLTEVLSLAHPEAFSRARRMETSMEAIAEKLGIQDPWEFRLAALFSQIGCISLPTEVVAKVNAGKTLSTTEAVMFNEHPAVAAKLLRNIPRLQRVAQMVEDQMVPPKPELLPKPTSEWPIEELGAQTLRIVSELDLLLAKDPSRPKALDRLRSHHSVPAAILEALDAGDTIQREMVLKSLSAMQIVRGMVLAQDVRCKSGVLLAREGQEVSDTMVSRLRNFVVGVGVEEPIQALVPV